MYRRLAKLLTSRNPISVVMNHDEAHHGYRRMPPSEGEARSVVLSAVVRAETLFDSGSGIGFRGGGVSRVGQGVAPPEALAQEQARLDGIRGSSTCFQDPESALRRRPTA